MVSLKDLQSQYLTLFLLAINDISKQIPEPITPLLYADDFSILCSNNFTTIKQILQNATYELIKRSETSGFRFSTEKSKLIIFNNKNKNKISINMGNQVIKNKKKIKILGIISYSNFKVYLNNPHSTPKTILLQTTKYRYSKNFISHFMGSSLFCTNQGP